MARLSLDGKVWKDPRVKRLAKRHKWSLRETIGTLAAVWDVAYDNKSPIMSRIDVDTAAETDNFAADMIAEDLATPIGDDMVQVRLRGVNERIQYLLAQADRGRAGGLAKAKRTPSERQASGKQPPGLPTATSPSPSGSSADPPADPVDGDKAEDQERVGAGAPRTLHPEALRLSRLLHGLIASASPGTKIAKLSGKALDRKVTDWATDVELLNRRDGIAYPDIEAALTWGRAHDFWTSVILSGDSLRRNYDQVLAQMTAPKNGVSKAPAMPSDADYEAGADWTRGAS